MSTRLPPLNQKKPGRGNKSLKKEAPKKIKEELSMGNKPVPLSTAIEVSKTICKITYTNNENKNVYGTGFFMLLKSSKYLISAYHILVGRNVKNESIEIENIKNKSIEIEIYNKSKINLELKSIFIKFYKRPKDIFIAEIKDSDGNKDIKYLNYDLNYKEGGYS